MTIESRFGWATMCSLLALALSLVVGGPLRVFAAESFRIETKIYIGEEKEGKVVEPVSKTTTLFQNGTVYDFLEQPEQTAVFRKPMGDKPGRFILLCDKEQIQTEISTEQLAGTMTKLRSWARQQKDPFLQFAAAPRFDETFDVDKGKLVLTSYLETYTVETTPTDHHESLVDYREFLDWYTQLNTLLATHVPPDPRLKLNDSLARHKVFPAKIELKRAGEDPIRAEHLFTWRLSQKDLQRIDDVRTGLASYRQTENQEFLKLTEPVELGNK